MKNKEISDIFEHMADILEFKGENAFRVNSYRKASRVLREFPGDIEAMAGKNRLKDITGIGASMAEKIIQYLKDGRIDKYEELKKDVPEGLMDILRVPAVGPKTALLLYRKLDIKDINSLEEAVKGGKLRGLPGMGEKKEKNILRGIRLLKDMGNRIFLGTALPVVEEIINGIKDRGVDMVSAAGSLRRMKETVGDIDVLAGASSGYEVINDFVRQPNVAEVLAAGDTKASVIAKGGIQVDLRVVPPGSFGAALQYFTGSKAHNIRLREEARAKGMKINEYGIFKGRKRIGGKDEDDIYRLLGMQWIPPVMREDRGEIECALKNDLPHLVSLDSIKGDLHVHSRWSDGTASLYDIVKAGKAMGYSYISVTDHSRSLKIARGLTCGKLEEQMRQIRKINEDTKGFMLLCGAEVDIANDGNMDFPDELLKRLDIVIGAVHTGFKQDKKTLTKRIVTAIKNPNVDIIAHPTGRLIGAREGYDIDMDEVLRAAAGTGTALELNAHYSRLDLNDIWARRAKELGVKLAIGTDSHSIDHLWMMRLGVAVAGRAWLRDEDVLNTLPARHLFS